MSNYSDALQFCVENGIVLNEAQTLNLYITMEGANIQLQKTWKQANTKLRAASKSYKVAYKTKDYRRAKAACNDMKKILNEFEKDINNIDFTSGSNIISQIIYALLTASLAIVGPLAGKINNHRIDKLINSHASGMIDNMLGREDSFRGNKADERNLKELSKYGKKANDAKLVYHSMRISDLKNSKDFLKKQTIITTLIGSVDAVLTGVQELKMAREDMKKNGGKIKDINMLRADINSTIKNDYKLIAALETQAELLKNA